MQEMWVQSLGQKGSWRIPYPHQHSCLGNPLAGDSPWNCKNQRMTWELNNRELSSVLCDDREGEMGMGWEEGNICVHKTDSCSALIQQKLTPHCKPIIYQLKKTKSIKTSLYVCLHALSSSRTRPCIPCNAWQSHLHTVGKRKYLSLNTLVWNLHNTSANWTGFVLLCGFLEGAAGNGCY